MAPARYNDAGAARKGPLTDASSKANSMANPPPSKPAPGPPASSQRYIPSAKASAKFSNNNKNIVPGKSYLAPPAQNHRNSAASYSSRNVTANHTVKTHIGPWQLGQTIGSGGTCTVRVVRHARTGAVAVAKIISKVTADKVRARSLANLNHRLETGDYEYSSKLALPVGLEREIVIMRLLNHPNIVRLYDVWENSNEIYLIMEQVEGGELFKFIEGRGPMKEKEAILLFRQLVEALMYCHRMQICHRDLKPENILIDKATMTIKVIDFGMAAYQPSGDLLKTPCGSPHYAAPELLRGKPYDGSKADVWSLTVVLFIMLTNQPPFNFNPDVPEDEKLGNLYDEIKACRVKLPSFLSREAKDLFRKAFVSSPQDRIDIKKVWEHPLLHKYDKEFQYQGRKVEYWIGEPPALTSWSNLTPDTIDSYIFRALRTLWHDADEKALVAKLCNDEFYSCPVKYFYSALIQYRESQLESLDWSPSHSGIVISKSDFHHGHGKPPLRKSASHLRSNSQFSVFQQEHFKSKHSFFEEHPSEISYDPFRAHSLEPVAVSKSKIQSRNAVHTASAKAAANQRHSLRVETLKRRGSLRSAAAARKSVSLKDISSDRLSISSKRSRTHSRTSTNSSHWLGNRSPITIAKPSQRHKKNVSFDHLRRRSVALSGLAIFDAALLDTSLPVISSDLENLDVPSSPPVMSAGVLLRARKGAPTPRTRRLKDIEHAARKVSTELEAACEKAFFRSSVSEVSFRSSTSEPLAPVTETPPSSISNRSSLPVRDSKTDKMFLNRPLPPTPREQDYDETRVASDTTETPCTYTTRQIYETRERLADKYHKEGLIRNKPFTDILKQLDRLMPDGLTLRQNAELSSSSSSIVQSSNDLNFLQPIPEEGRFNDSDELLTPNDPNARRVRTLSRQSNMSTIGMEKSRGLTTIRIVEPSSPGTPTPLAPLKIRKSMGYTYSENLSVEHESYARSSSLPGTTRLVEVLEERRPVEVPGKAPSKSSWWRRVSNNSTVAKERDSKRTAHTASSGSDWEDLDDRVSRRNERAAAPRDYPVTGTPKLRDDPIEAQNIAENSRYYGANYESQQQTPTKTSNYFLDRSTADAENDGGLKRSGFLKAFFQKKNKPVYGVDRDLSINLPDGASDMGLGNISATSVSPISKKKDPTEWNLLDRLLWFKPESKVLVMSHPRKASRLILCRALSQEWNSGIKDLAFDDKNRNTFTGRLDKANKWNLKPVSFVLEFFSILRDGKQSSLTAVRFTQIRGCGASLRKLVEMLCQHLENGHLHTEAKEVKEITKLIQTGRIEPE